MNKGVTRLVFCIGKFAIKIPNFTNSHLHFLNGCYANWSERNFCKMFKDSKDLKWYYEAVAPSYFCSWFGLIQIQARCTVNIKPLTEQEIQYFEPYHNGDTKPQNFGFYKGNLVCLDYP